MPAKDLYHDQVKHALIRDGWIITHDPLRLSWGGKDMYVDLGAERLLAAEKAGQQIAVEIKTFAGQSPVNELEKALGQYVVYRTVLTERQPHRRLYLAVPETAYREVFEEPLGQLLLTKNAVNVIAFNPQTEEITTWTPPTAK